MSSLISLAVYDTEENQRTKYTISTIESLKETLTEWSGDRIIVIDNGSCQETKDYLMDQLSYFNSPCYDRHNFTVITNPTNVGTAKAINQAWALRKPGEYLIKMDNDVVIHSYGWVEELEEAIERDPKIGIVGLKRKDLFESPYRNDMFKSELRMLPHKNGERWIIVEDVQHVMGTCQMYNPKLIDKIGGLYQMYGIYGFDDTMSAVRAKVTGFKSCFLPHIEIDHIDTGENPYQKEKEAYAASMMARFNQEKDEMLTGQRSIYVPL